MTKKFSKRNERKTSGEQYKKITPNHFLMWVFVSACMCITTYMFIYITMYIIYICF